MSAEVKAPVERAKPQMAERFASFVRAEHEHAIALAYHLTGGDRELAKDVAQEAFLQAHRALPRFRGDSELRTWFIRILIRQAARSKRRQRWLPEWLWPTRVAGEQEEGPAVPPPRARERVRRRIARALASLSSGQREAFVLVHLDGFTVEEAAALLSKSPGTMKSHLHRALTKLRGELAGELEEVCDEG